MFLPLPDVGQQRLCVPRSTRCLSRDGSAAQSLLYQFISQYVSYRASVWWKIICGDLSTSIACWMPVCLWYYFVHFSHLPSIRIVFLLLFFQAHSHFSPNLVKWRFATFCWRINFPAMNFSLFISPYRILGKYGNPFSTMSSILLSSKK